MSTTGKKWPAPAKLNLFLHVTGRRPDGYHTLQTVFQFIDLADRLEFTVTNDAGIVRTPPLAGVPAQRDLVLRAAKKLQQISGCKSGVRINVETMVPMGGGLGGGSSNAATTLIALNQLWQLRMTTAELAEIGLGLGADVPVFINGESAWAEGIGERLSGITLPEPYYLIIYPGCRVMTRDIFNADDLTRNTAPITIADFLNGAGSNDCETVVRKRHPAVGEALDWLNQFADAKLTGTGACLFAAFSDYPRAVTIHDRLPEHWQGFIAKGRNRSPLFVSA